MTNNHSLNVIVHKWICFQQISILFIFQRFERYTTLIVKELFSTSISKSVITYITLTKTNISNNIMKHYYGILKTLKVLVIVKKKQFSRTKHLQLNFNFYSFPKKISVKFNNFLVAMTPLGNGMNLRESKICIKILTFNGCN